MKLDKSDGRDEAEIACTGRGLVETEVCSVQHKLLPPCAGFPTAAVPSSGEVGVRAPSAMGPK